MIGVKKNQKTLHAAIAGCSDQALIGYHGRWDRNKGRWEYRGVSVFDLPQAIKEQWAGAQQGIKVVRKVKKKGSYRQDQAYYLSSIAQGSALLYQDGIRGHWQIENSLHWTKDVTMREDASRIRTGNAPSIVSTIKNVAINIFRKQGMGQIAKATRLVAHDIETLTKLII